MKKVCKNIVCFPFVLLSIVIILTGYFIGALIMVIPTSINTGSLKRSFKDCIATFIELVDHVIRYWVFNR